MSAAFILSFDCEGKWGIADGVTPFIDSHFTNERLNEAYATLLNQLERYRIFATFAFVGAFTLSEREYLDRRDWFESHDEWLTRFHEDARRRAYDGWLNPQAFEMVRETPGHEIACHGFTHRPLCESMATREQMRDELRNLRRLSTFSDANTFIYPRNLVGYESLLTEFGFDGYRAGVREVRGSWARVQSLLQETNIFARSEPIRDKTSALTVIPGGHIINWRRGLRGMVPAVVSLQRVRSMIRNAVAHNEVVHLWSHPHNFVTGRNMHTLFEEILRMVVKERDAGNLEVLTQAQFVSQVSRPAPSRQAIAMEVAAV